MNLFEQIKMRTNTVLKMDKSKQQLIASEQIQNDIGVVLNSYAKLTEKPHVLIEVCPNNRFKISIEALASEFKSLN